jgi:phosphatidylethanolamine-binding protein (PEBP) family uncharacterized protein
MFSVGLLTLRNAHCRGGDNQLPSIEILDPDVKARKRVVGAEVWDIDTSPQFLHWRTDDVEAALRHADAKKYENSFGELGYSGPCPPKGYHTYRFQFFDPRSAPSEIDRDVLQQVDVPFGF